MRTQQGYLLPGGGVEPNERFEAALQRKIVEELGYQSRIGEEHCAAVQYLYSEAEHEYFKKYGHFFRATLMKRVCEPTELDDHCGVPRVSEKILDPWRSNIREIAKSPNVFCKISGLIAYADPHNWTPEDLRPYIDHVVECFGWDGVMFGSDCPACTLSASYRQWVDLHQSLTHYAGEVNQRKLFHDNAMRVYRLT